MKRYRILNFEFDSRPRTLAEETRDEWEDKIKQQHINAKEEIIKDLQATFGPRGIKTKAQNFIDIGVAPFSIAAFHNKFLKQIRASFVIGAYYPALTATCALGERILNHLILRLHEFYRDTPEYKRIHRKDSFDDWRIAISTLASWQILLPETQDRFEDLRKLRNDSLHFRPETDTNDRDMALQGIKYMQAIVAAQFPVVGNVPWLITEWPSEPHIRKVFENNHFVREIYLPNCQLVGYRHRVASLVPVFKLEDNFDYDTKEITDAEFADLRKADLGRG